MNLPDYLSYYMSSYYELLELEQSADLEQIRAAYIRKATRWHPDNNAGSEEAEEQVRQLSEAYRVLSNPSSRHAYDRALRLGQPESDFPAPSADTTTPKEVFFKEMTDFAVGLTVKNATGRVIQEELGKKGCPSGIAGAIARQAEASRKSQVRRSFAKDLIRAMAALILGAAFTLVFYFFTAPGGTYAIPIGLFLYCGFYVVRALYFVISGNVPKGRARRVSPEAERKDWETRMAEAPENYCHICNKTYDNAAVYPVHGERLTRIV